ncbi:Gfo/Idh/MocA family protein [Anaerophilus nitritogenes]|uniref:Gfo/Idh/MocA family protein n=1 Tax=Anaerophilus nitritogenes TaxID=2498136 RepID=UPI001FAAFBA7|nr:Gfo/Idh/MocA family oxidoreductase [Anaerophilus nitritogenes]
MNHYKIAIIGLGSIGSRHLLNIAKVLSEKNITYSIDLIRSNKGKGINEELKELIDKVYCSYEDVPKDYDVIFITNPTHLHYETIKQYVPNTKHMFIEKPVFDDANKSIKNLSLKRSGIYYIACPLRYTNVIQYLKNEVDLSKVYSVRVICSSYLPDWRPGVDYRNTYSAHLEEGGGVSIDLIHEWDYINYLFGKPKEVYNLRGKYSDLEIDSDDLSVYIAKYPKMLAEVHLDYFGRNNMREIQLFTKEDTIIADIANSEIRYMNNNKVISFKEERNDFQRKEIEYFFDVIKNKKENQNDIRTAINTLKIAKEGKS